jgi:mRNA interferase MazF
MNPVPYQFGDVILVPFPFSNQTAGKQRPAVVISSVAYHANRPDLLIMAITSQAHTAQDFATVTLVDWSAANLLKPSYAKPVLTTLEQALVIRRMGSLTAFDQHALRNMIAQLIG